MKKASRVFLSVEGGEGLGKSLFCRGIQHDLAKLTIDLFVTHEPGGTAVGQAVREIFLDPPKGVELNALTELFLLSAARAQHVLGPIKEKLAAGSWVLCDRFFDSTRVYQGILGGVPCEELERVLSISIQNLTPNVTFLLDCDTEVVMERLKKRDQLEGSSRFDSAPEEYHRQLREAYLEIAARFPQRFEILDASKEPELVRVEALERLASRGLISY